MKLLIWTVWAIGNLMIAGVVGYYFYGLGDTTNFVLAMVVMVCWVFGQMALLPDEGGSEI